MKLTKNSIVFFAHVSKSGREYSKFYYNNKHIKLARAITRSVYYCIRYEHYAYGKSGYQYWKHDIIGSSYESS